MTNVPRASWAVVAMLGCSALLGGLPCRAQASPDDARILAGVQKALDKKQLKQVQGTVQNGAVTLTGTVDLYAYKEDAEKRVRHDRAVTAINDQIVVAGPTIEDATLRNKLAQKLSLDRVGYGTTTFNAITIGVRDGVVTLGGMVYGPPDKDSALGLIAYSPGVKGIVDRLAIAPLSPMDDRLRVQLASVIYGAAELQKYAIDPAKPIRITVDNGNVTLSGVVDSKMDSEVANLRANSVSGVFKVVNNLQYPGAQSGN